MAGTILWFEDTPAESFARSTYNSRRSVPDAVRDQWDNYPYAVLAVASEGERTWAWRICRKHDQPRLLRVGSGRAV